MKLIYYIQPNFGHQCLRKIEKTYALGITIRRFSGVIIGDINQPGRSKEYVPRYKAIKI